MNIRRILHITNILYFAVAKWPYKYRWKQRQFQSLDIMSIEKHSIAPSVYTETLKPSFQWISKLVLHRDSSLLNMVEAKLPYKHQVTIDSSKITDCCTQLLPPGPCFGDSKTYLIYGDKISSQFKMKCFIWHL